MSESAKIREQETLILQSFEKASQMLSPLWDIRDYVAVNPFFGLREQRFRDACQYIKNLTGYSIFPKKNYFLHKYKEGEITEYDFNVAKNLCKKESVTTKELLDFIQTEDQTPFKLEVKSLSDCYDLENHTNITELITNEVSRWASAYFDEGQALWSLPTDGLRFFSWWKSLARFDKPFKANNAHYVKLIRTLSDEPQEALQTLTQKLLEKVIFSPQELTNYYSRLIQSCLGWSSFMKKFEFEATRSGDDSKLKEIGGLIDIVAVRMTYDVALLESIKELKVKNLHDETREKEAEFDYYYLWLNSLESSYRRSIEEKIKSSSKDASGSSRFDVQMAFCIDVRSEVLRRHLENLSQNIQTIGFAGFFGIPLSIRGLGHSEGDQNCPILLNPSIEINEVSECGEFNLVKKKEDFAEFHYQRKLAQSSANAGFSFVETLGFGYIVKMLASSLNRKKPDIDISSMGLSDTEKKYVHLNTDQLSSVEKVSLAYGALKNMGLTQKFAKYVFFFGHGSESSNNPYASALDCGACAGHNGFANAYLLATLLNEKEVRKDLEDKGIYIPDDTLFLSGWHNTTKDDLYIDELENLKSNQKEDLRSYLKIFEDASQGCREERARKLPFCQNIKGRELQRELLRKANDWSEIRPEWGLARNASFIVARRNLTRELHLDGRSFLHDYDFSEDSDLSKLELIMTAPMVVTNWINMQYYASAVNPKKYGAGNKVLNNVVGTIGCIQGNESDLLGGLTEQSVLYKGDYFHEPLRLQVFIEAETSAIDKIIKKHKLVEDLVLNNWLKLISIDPENKNFKLYQNGDWINTKEEL